MPSKAPKIMPLAAALAALTGTAGIVAGPATAKTVEPTDADPAGATLARSSAPNQIVSVGRDFLGFIVTDQADGTVLAEHYSHTSHASHSSHASHTSSRY